MVTALAICGEAGVAAAAAVASGRCDAQTSVSGREGRLADTCLTSRRAQNIQMLRSTMQSGRVHRGGIPAAPSSPCALTARSSAYGKSWS